MAIKTFVSGEILTAADTNTYLANSGLVFIKSQTVGTGVSSVPVTDAFSATYDNYRIIYSGGVGSATDANIELKLGSSVTNYSEALVYNTFALPTPAGVGRQVQSTWVWIGNSNPFQALVNVDLFGPFLSAYTIYRSQAFGVSTGNGSASGIHSVASSYTGFTLTPNSGTLTGGTIIIYGYRKA